MKKIKLVLKNYSLLNNKEYVFEQHKKLLIQFFMLLFCTVSHAQHIGNYVANGSFEETNVNCTTANFIWNVSNWGTIDSSSFCFSGGVAIMSVCNNRVPLWGSFYQFPKTGNAYAGGTFYFSLARGYLRNRLKSALQVGKTYCVKFHVNIMNNSTYGIDGLAAYFGNDDIDTISCFTHITYLSPQVQNPQGNIITDTLNWVAITGTFTANGTEKYLLLGNFLANNVVDTLMINPTHLPTVFTDVGIDDVSCIEVDLPAYAGRDTTILVGDSVYIGRENDFAIDPYCVWYKLPDTANAIDTTSGLWVKPSVTTTYVVKQELECSSLKWDTVVVNVGYVGIEEYEINNLQVELYPNPTENSVIIKSNRENERLNIVIQDLTGRIIDTKTVHTKSYVANIEFNLLNGVYLITINNSSHESITKKLLIAK